MRLILHKFTDEEVARLRSLGNHELADLGYHIYDDDYEHDNPGWKRVDPLNPPKIVGQILYSGELTIQNPDPTPTIRNR